MARSVERGVGQSRTDRGSTYHSKTELLTVIAYVSPTSPWRKFPLCDLAMVRSATCTTVVGSVAVSLAVFNSPPPETVAELVNDAGAFLSTLTVRVMTG